MTQLIFINASYMYGTMLVHALYIYKNSLNYPNTSLIKE